MLASPRIKFAVRNGTHLAYQAEGQGPPDMVFVGGSMATTLGWDDPVTAKGFRRLASFSRLVTYDQWGTGSSDRFDPSDAPNLTDLVGDLAAVIDAAGVTDPVLFGTHNGGAVAALYAAAHPVRQLVLCNTWARLQVADDFPIGFSDRVLDRLEERYRTEWGQGRIYNEFAPRYDDAPPGRVELASTSQNQLVTIFRINRTYDIRSVLPTISAPTLVIHLEGNANIPPDHGRFIADSIPGRPPGAPPRDRPGLPAQLRHTRDRRGGAVRHGRYLAVHRSRPGRHPVHRHRRLHPHGRLPGRRGLERRRSTSTTRW